MGRRFPLGLTFKPSLKTVDYLFSFYLTASVTPIYTGSLYFSFIIFHSTYLSVFFCVFKKNGWVKKKTRICVTIIFLYFFFSDWLIFFYYETEVVVVFNSSYFEKWEKKSKSTTKNTKTQKKFNLFFNFSKNKLLFLLNRYTTFFFRFVDFSQ